MHLSWLFYVLMMVGYAIAVPSDPGHSSISNPERRDFFSTLGSMWNKATGQQGQRSQSSQAGQPRQRPHFTGKNGQEVCVPHTAACDLCTSEEKELREPTRLQDFKKRRALGRALKMDNQLKIIGNRYIWAENTREVECYADCGAVNGRCSPLDKGRSQTVTYSPNWY